MIPAGSDQGRSPPTEGGHDVVVVGAGITGLACAYTLAKAGVDVVVLESRNRVGGCIESVHHEGGFLFESGPHTVRGADRELIDHLHELGLGGRVLDLGRSGASRFIVRDGRPVALPSSPFGFFTSGFLSPRGKLRVLREPWIGPAPDDDPSLGDFIEHRLGPEVRYGPLDAFVGGVWAGDPDRISARAVFPELVDGVSKHGSLLRYALAKRRRTASADDGTAPDPSPSGRGSASRDRDAAEELPASPGPKMFGLEGGLAAWPRELADALGGRVKTGASVASLERVGGTGRSLDGAEEGRWAVTFEGARGGGRVTADHVVLTGGPRATARVARRWLSDDAASRLEAVRSASLGVVHLGYGVDAADAAPRGFGALVPGREGRSCLGILFASSLLPHRAPPDALSTTTFFGGIRDEARLEGSNGELVELAHREHAELLGFHDPPRVGHVRRWSAAIPQYGLDHGPLMAALEAQEDRVPDLHLAGRYRGGVSVPDCWRRGRDLGRRLGGTIHRDLGRRPGDTSGHDPGGTSTAPGAREETAAATPSARSRP